jgi:arabinogalactan endo-1,4-beta-galactosidase
MRAAVCVPAAILISLACFSACRVAESLPTPTPTPGTQLDRVEGLRSDFIKGADVSMLKQLEISGGKFYDESGAERDALLILRDHGINWVRLRIWNNPVFARDLVEGGVVIAHAGDSVGGGNCDEAKTLEVASRAKALGLKVLLDFHYSDFWADPGQQNKPAAWVDLDAEELGHAVYDFTSKTIADMRAAGAAPDMVQIGNEVTNGMLWPEGAIWGAGAGGYNGFAALLKRGIRAVRDQDPNAGSSTARIKVMIHLDNGGNNALYRSVFSELVARGVDFDVIGLSFYPYWHGTLSQLKSNMDDISRFFDKDVVVAETSYANTLEDGDACANIFGASQLGAGGYPATVAGQATFIRDLVERVSSVPQARGLGIFYWEPDWIPVAGAGWRTGDGDAWDNQALFDFRGRALPSLNVFALVSTGG